MADPAPKLRVIDEDAPSGDDVVRLNPDQPAGGARARGAAGDDADNPERLEGAVRENFDGRTHEPGVETFMERAELQPQSVEQEWGEPAATSRGLPLGWVAVIVAVAVGGGIWALSLMSQGEKEVAQKQDEVRILKEDDAVKDLEARQFVERVEQVLKDYLAADSMDEILPLVRHSEIVGPLIKEEWKIRPKQGLEFRRLASFRPVIIDGRSFWIVRAEASDASSVNLVVEQTPGNDALVDWELSVTHQPMDWETYIRDRPSGSALEFRVWAVPDNLFSHEFADSKKWRCYQLTASGSNDFLFGYAPVDGEIASELDSLSRMSPSGSVPVLLRLRIPEGTASPRGVVIEKIVEPRWLRANPASEDGP